MADLGVGVIGVTYLVISLLVRGLLSVISL
jgi:hypothetical protein